MKLKINFSKLFDNDKFVKIISVVIAIITWFIVVITVNPSATSVIRGVEVNLDLTGTAPESYGLNIVDGSGQTVDIKLDGKNYVIGSLKKGDFVAIPSFSTVTKPGTYSLPIEVQRSNSGVSTNDYTISSYSSHVIVAFDYVVEQTFEVSAIADNVKAAEGYIKEAIMANPDKITVKGPESEIAKIKKVRVESKGSEIIVEDSVIVDGELVFYDDADNKLQLKNVSYPEQQKFEINVQIYMYKTVPVSVNFVNIPTGLDVSKLPYSMSESEIEVAGPRDTVSKMSSISLGDIDFRNVNIDSVFDMSVSLPAGVMNSNNITNVAVFIEGQDFERKQLSITNFSKKNEPAGYNISIETQAINNVKIVGNTEDLENVTSNDLIAVIDLQGVDLSSGKTRVNVQIYCSGNKFVWAVGEYSVIVTATPN